MDELTRNLINRYQGDVPLVNRPFAAMADELDTSEVHLISTINKLLETHLLSRFGPLYNSSCMGGGLTLAALSVPENDFDRVTNEVNQLPQVAHNYRRDHQLNMWFVIATETQQQIPATIETIEQLTSLQVYNFPKLREYYLGLWLAIDELDRVHTRSSDVVNPQHETSIDSIDRDIIRVTQSGLPLIQEPFAEIAEQLESNSETILKRISRMLDCGIIRRIGAVPNHYRLGLTANGMSVWDVADDKVDELGEKIGQLDFVSHCYQRPRHMPVWPYNLFAMVHGHNRQQVNDKVAEISRMLGSQCQQHDVLYSSAILKKSGLRLVA